MYNIRITFPDGSHKDYTNVTLQNLSGNYIGVASEDETRRNGLTGLVIAYSWHHIRSIEIVELYEKSQLAGLVNAQNSR